MGTGKKGSSRRDVRRRDSIHHDSYEKGVSSAEKGAHYRLVICGQALDKRCEHE
jgi:hypothetical protein